MTFAFATLFNEAQKKNEQKKAHTYGVLSLISFILCLLFFAAF